MAEPQSFNCFAVCIPGLEKLLFAEAREKGFPSARYEKGGVTFKGSWEDIWRANLALRGASKILVRIASFPVFHLAQLDKKARKFDWGDFLPTQGDFKVEATCIKSKIYHEKAACQRIENAISDQLGSQPNSESNIIIKVRIIENTCTISLDTSGEGLHKRGNKQALNKAPLRETIASLCLRACGYDGMQTVLDPMCGSGTFILEAAEWAQNQMPGIHRSFAFENFQGFDDETFKDLKSQNILKDIVQKFYGYDRDAGAIKRSQENSVRSEIDQSCTFEYMALGKIQAPECTPGIVMTNPPYGVRIGDRKKLLPLYQSFGNVMRDRFKGWRIGLLAHSPELVNATGLPFEDKPLAFSHGGIAVKLYQAEL